MRHRRYEVVSALRDAAEAFDDTPRFLDVYLGHGMNQGLNANTVIGRVFYIPAQRALLLADG